MTIYFEDLYVGLTETYERTVGVEDIVKFADVSGDNNPVHLDDEYAAGTMFKGRIAHGMLGASFISTVLGTKLPGTGTIYLGQNLKFKAPVRPGDVVVAKVEVTELDPAKRKVILKTTCSVGGTVVIDGEATVLAPARP